MKITNFEMVEAKDIFEEGDNNEGYIFGIHWLNGDDIVECEWHKTRKSRQQAIRKQGFINGEFVIIKEREYLI